MPSEIAAVMKILKRNLKRYENPIVAEIGKAKDPFIVLVSCILSLRTQDATTAKASAKLFALARTPKKMASLPIKQIEKAVYSVNFYRTKARRIKNIARILVEKYDSKVPSDFDELLKFKGVGRKTANIVMTYGFNRKDFIAVDTHVHRISNRLGWVNTAKADKTEFALRKTIPKRYWYDLNDTFVTFGQNVCKPIKPKCWECPITRYCKYYKEVYLSSSAK